MAEKEKVSGIKWERWYWIELRVFCFFLGCYCFLLGQQTGTDSTTAYLLTGIPRPHQKAGTGEREETSITNSMHVIECWDYYSNKCQKCCPKKLTINSIFAALCILTVYNHISLNVKLFF